MEEYGNIASVVGLFVSIAGFMFTLYQVWKTRKAAEKAQEIAREALNRVGHQLLSAQINTAITMGQDIGSFCRLKQWGRAFGKCEQLRILLANQVEDTRLRDDERHHVRAHIADLSFIMRRLKEIERQEGTPELPSREMEFLDKIVISLTGIDGRLRNEILEARHG